MAHFDDRRVIDVLIRHVARLRGSPHEKEAPGIANLSTMTQLMHRDQIEAVDAAMTRSVPSDYDKLLAAAILAVERLRPNGSQVVADAIEEQIKTSIEKGDHRLIARDAPWKRTRYRLLARLD